MENHGLFELFFGDVEPGTVKVADTDYSRATALVGNDYISNMLRGDRRRDVMHESNRINKGEGRGEANLVAEELGGGGALLGGTLLAGLAGGFWGAHRGKQRGLRQVEDLNTRLRAKYNRKITAPDAAHLVNLATGRGGNRGLIAGAALGAGIPLGLAGILALTKKRRSLKEQAEKDKSGKRVVAKYFVPGLAQYDMWKRIGASKNFDEQ